MPAIFFDLSEQFLANGYRPRYYGIVRTVMEVGYEMAKSDAAVRFVIYSPAHGRFFEVTPRLDAASPTGVMDPGLPPEATPIRLRQSFPTRKKWRDGLLTAARPVINWINRRRWQHVPARAAVPVDLDGQVLISLGRPKIMADYLINLERRGTRVRLIPLLHDMIPLHAFADREKTMFTSHFMHDNRHVIGRAHLLLANSVFTKQEITHFGDEGHFPDLPPVVAVPLSHELRPTGEPVRQAPPQQPYVLCVGTQTGRKNLECVMDALLNLSEQNRPVPRLVLAGARRKRTETYVRQSKFAAIRDQVQFYCNPNQTELAALYQGAHALIISSYMEGWGLPLGEALWLGTPALASHAPALQEVGGDLAFYFDPADPVALARLIDHLQSDADAYAALKARITAARPRLRSWRHVAQDILTASEALPPLEISA